MDVNSLSPSHPCVRYPAQNHSAPLRLFCFPYACAGASVFYSWPSELTTDVELCAVQLPGREDKLLEPPFVRLEPLTEALADALQPHLDKPFAFFGHSMGALIAFEFARQLRRQKRAGPAHLFVAGHRAPHLPDRRPPIHHLPDELLIEELRRLKGTPEEILEHAELSRLLFPLVRADFALCETYSYLPEPPLDCPIAAIGGIEDAEVAGNELAAWREHTRGAFHLQMLPGDHFFLHNARPLLLDILSRALVQLVRQRQEVPVS